MKKKILALALVVAMLAIAVVGGTLAYFTDKDYKANTMTIGNIEIDQLEYERLLDENGDPVLSDAVDNYGYYPAELKEFTDDKLLFPAVGDIAWESAQQSFAQIEAPGSIKLLAMENVVDKMVFVENTGKNDAYVRTLVALERGTYTGDLDDVIMTNSDQKHWTRELVATSVGIDGNTYDVYAFTYVGPSTDPTGILAAGAVSYPSLAQVYMTSAATQEDAEALDGNDNGKYDILVLTQATQVNGFADAVTALDTSFGDMTADTVKTWFEAE